MMINRWHFVLRLLVISVLLSFPVRAENENRRLKNPAQRIKAEYTSVGGIKVALWRSSQSGPMPLVIFSHGFHGSYKQSTFLMEALATSGFLAIAPNHADANRLSGGSGGRPEESFKKAQLWTSSTYEGRLNDLKSLIHGLKEDPAFSGLIDWTNVGMAGHSLGGYTALGTGGGWTEWRLPEIKAVLALSPYSQPFIVKKTLGNLAIPVMYQGGTEDTGTTPAIRKNKGAYTLSPSPAYFVNFKGAGHFAWTDLNEEYQTSIKYYSIAFFNRYLKGIESKTLSQKRPDVEELLSK